MSNVPVALYLHPIVYRRWALLAEAQATQVHTLIEHLAQQTVMPGTTYPKGYKHLLPDPVDGFIRERHAEGWSDRRIARELGVTQPTVSRRRRRMGLPALDAFPGKNGRRGTDSRERVYTSNMDDVARTGAADKENRRTS